MEFKITIKPSEKGGYVANDISTGLTVHGNTKIEALEKLEEETWLQRIKLLKLQNTLKNNLYALARVASETIPVSITTLHKLAFFAKNEGLFPPFIPNIHHHGVHCLDIDYTIQGMIKDGVFELEFKEVRTHQTSYYASERLMKLLKIKPNEIYLPPGYEEKLQDLIRRVGSIVSEHGDRTKEFFIEKLRRENNYHYASPEWIIREVERIREEFTPYPLRQLGGIYLFLGKLAHEIIEKKEEQRDYVFFIEDIKKAFSHQDTWSQTKGFLCLQVGHFSNILKETESELRLYFTNRLYYPNGRIRVILDKHGVFKIEPNNLRNNQYLLLGRIDEYSGEPIIKVAALIYLEDIPVDFPQFYYEET